MPWQPLPRIAFAVCTYPFQPSSPADLPLEIGDELYIIEQGGEHGAWLRGYLVAPPSLLAGLTTSKGQILEARVFSGIFPRTCIEIREELGDNRVPDINSEHGPGREPAQESRRLANSPSQRRTSTINFARRLSVTGRHGEGRPQRVSRNGSDSGSKKQREATLDDGARAGGDGELEELDGAYSPQGGQENGISAAKPVAPVPLLKIGDETPTSVDEPLVDEIASCLREWYSTKLHELLLSRQYSSLDKLSSLVTRLDHGRRRLLHKVLTAQELELLREETIWALVAGNKILSGEVIVRSPSERGRILTSEDSAMEVAKLQSMMSVLDKPPKPQTDSTTLHHLLAELRIAPGDISQPAALNMYLVSKPYGATARPVSEVYGVDINADETIQRSDADPRLRTLFTDMSSSDIGGEAGPGTSLYLVLKLITSEQTRPLSSFTDGYSEMSDPHSAQWNKNQPVAHIPPTKGGRRSMMFSQKRSEPATPNFDKQTPARGWSPARTLSNEDGEDTRPKSARVASHQVVKRIAGVGILRVDKSLRHGLELDEDVFLWSPGAVNDGQAASEGWDAVIEELLSSPSGRYVECRVASRIRVHTKAFTYPDSDELVRKTPTLLQGLRRTRKMGFSGAPTKPRSDIYLTLSELVLPKNCSLYHPKSGSLPLPASSLNNLQLTLEVRNRDGERIEKCIYPSSNSAGHTAWRTSAAARDQAWDQTIKLAVPPEDVPGCHIIMSVADAPNFPFGLCWIPLWHDEAFVRDGDHILALYKYDEYTSSIISGKGAYLTLPWSTTWKEDSATSPMASLRLRTFLASTKYSQDANLLGLLRWEEHDQDEILNLLKMFAFVPEIEVVKLLDECFDALFSILASYAGDEKFEDHVFDALIVVLGIVHDRRFNLQPLVDDYIERRFQYPGVSACLIRSWSRILQRPTESESSRRLRAACKVGKHGFRFIVKSRQQQDAQDAESGIRNGQFKFLKEIRGICKSFEILMQHASPVLVGTKTIVVQNFHCWLPELSPLISARDVFNLATSFLDSCTYAEGKLIMYKLVLVLNINRLDLFMTPEIRASLKKKTMAWLEPYWGIEAEVNDQYKDQVRLCCSIFAVHLSDLEPEAATYIYKLVESYQVLQTMPRTNKPSLSLPFPSSYPFPTRPGTASAHYDEALVEISALLAAASNLPVNIRGNMLMSDLSDFLFNALKVHKSILDCEAYPSTWLSMHIYHHTSTLRYLEKISAILIENFLPVPDEADEFHTGIWRAFFDALLLLVGSQSLALEVFPEQKRRAVWKIAGDIRERGAELLQHTWNAIAWDTTEEDERKYGLERMGGFQVQYVPSLVGPITELCLSVHEGLRSVAVEILQSMIVSEWALAQDLSVIQAEMIDCLDNLFKTRDFSESVLSKLFISELLGRCESIQKQEPLLEVVKSLIGNIDELLDLLMAVHNTEGEASRLMDTLRLIDFLKHVGRQDLYVRYVHHIATVQAENKNYTQAGLALCLHADLYEWDSNQKLPALTDPPFPPQSAFDRKEKLYFQMIQHFEDGQAWENALEAYKELATQYKHTIFDFSKLARTQRAMATVHESISNYPTATPRYFRVAYKGLGFPAGLRDKQFIFETSATDHLSTFTDRMQQQHPTAEVSSGGSTSSITEGQLLQISSVSVQKDLLHPVLRRTRIPQPIKDYFLLSNPKHFTTTLKRQASNVGVTDQIVEKEVFRSAGTFPTILKRSEIVAFETICLTPLQIGVERTIRKTQELASLYKRVKDGDDHVLSTLTELLMLMVDPQSDASVSRYRELLPQMPNPLLQDWDQMGAADEPELSGLQSALRVALLDHALITKSCLGLFSRSAYLATQADLTQRFEISFAPELAVLAPAAGDLSTSPIANRHVSPQLENPPSWPDVSLIPGATPPLEASSFNQTAPIPMDDHYYQTIPEDHRDPERRVSRQDQKRLSLTFLKRASFTSPKRETSPAKSGSRSRHGLSSGSKSGPVSEMGTAEPSMYLSKAITPAHSRSQSQSKEPIPSGYTASRTAPLSQEESGHDVSRQREEPRSRSDSSSSSGLAGSMKKRFSKMGIGKKGSKGSVGAALRGIEEDR